MSYPEEEEMNPEGEVLVATTAVAVIGSDVADVLGENGEALSKNALKKKLKAEKAAQAKAEKESAKKVRNLLFFFFLVICYIEYIIFLHGTHTHTTNDRRHQHQLQRKR